MKTCTIPCLAVLSLLTGSIVHGAEAPQAPAAASKFSTYRDAYDAGNALLKQREFDKAVAAYQAAEGLADAPSVKSKASNAAGWALVKAKKWVAAREQFRRAAAENPKNKYALGNQGYAALKIYQYGLGNDDDLKESVTSLEACSVIDPAYKADLLETVKTIQSRMEASASATPIAAPKAGLSYREAVALGDQAQAQGQYDLAIQYFKRAETAGPNSKSKGSAANRQGLALLEARRPKESVAHLERAVQLEPGEKVFLNNLGLANWNLYDAGLADVESLKKAVDCFFKSNSLDPSYHGENLRMTLGELREVDPAAAKSYDSGKDPATGEAAPMGSPTVH